MDKTTYIKKLRKALKGYPEHLVDEIIEEYESHFEFGQEQGKTQQQISKELGDPKEVANEYLGSQPIHKVKKRVVSFGQVLFFLIFLVGLFTILPHLLKITANVLVAVLWFIVIILALGAVVAFILYQVFKHKWNQFKGNGGIVFNWSDKEKKNVSDVEQLLIHDLDNVHTLKVISLFEKLNIEQSNTMDFQAHLKGKSNLEDVMLKMEDVDGVLTISTGQQRTITQDNYYKVELDIVIPQDKKLNIIVDSSLGENHIRGQYESIKVESNLGNIHVYGHQKDIQIESNMGNVYGHEFNGSGNITANMGNIIFDDCSQLTGRIKMTTKMGKIKSESSYIQLDEKAKDQVITLNDGSNYLVLNTKMGNIKFK